MHYQDNYFTVGPANSPVCDNNVKSVIWITSHLGENKLERPTTCLVFLCILIETDSMETSLPEDRLHKLLAELHSWSSHNKCIKRELLSPISKLNFTCRIIPAGCIFLYCLFISPARLSHHHELQSLLRHCLVAQVSSFLEWPCHHTWPPLDQVS